MQLSPPHLVRDPALVTLARPAASLAGRADPTRAWSRDALTGRLVELPAEPGTAAVSATVILLLGAQRAGEPVAWVTSRDELPLAEDLRAAGVDLDGLLVVRAPDGPRAGLAADRLLRSSAFGVVVLDLARGQAVPVAQLGRLTRLAALHDAVVVALVDGASHGSLVALRVRAQRHRDARGVWRLTLTAEKDKRAGPGDLAVAIELRVPPGLDADAPLPDVDE